MDQEQAKAWLKARGIDCSQSELETSGAKLRSLTPDAHDPAVQKLVARITALGCALGITTHAYMPEELTPVPVTEEKPQ